MTKKYFFHRHEMPSIVAPLSAGYMYDRTQKVFPKEMMATITPIGDPLATRKSFAELCEQRAEEILTKVGNYNIAVAWSGGLDSTCVMASILDKVDPNNLTVVMNDSSIAEYPWFYDTYIKDKIKTIPMERHSVDLITSRIVDQGGVYLTGEIGDQLFGSIHYASYNDQSDLLKPWETLLEDVSPETVNVYTRLVASCPVPMTSVKMFWWWMNYAWKYQGVQLRMIMGANNAKLEENVFHFFDGKGFNDYTMYTDIEEKYPGIDPKNYKMPMKNYILSKTGDEDYAKNKMKVISLYIVKGKLWQTFTPLSIDTNWNREYEVCK